MYLKAHTRFWLDMFLFVSFLIFMQPALTGITVHEWFATATILAFLLHVLSQWDWIIAVGKRFFHKFFHQSRLNFVLDLLLLIGMTTVMVSGFLISHSLLPTLGFPERPNFFWRRIHDISANVTLGIVALHIGLHWNWLVNTARRLVKPVSRTRPNSEQGRMVQFLKEIR